MTEHRYDPYSGADVVPGKQGSVSASAALGLEPPRFCTDCGRKMIVQIVPDGWTARCSRHGVLESASDGRR